MRLKLTLTLVVAGVILLGATASSGAAPLLSILNVYTEEENLCLDFYLKDAIDRDVIQTMRNGVPTLLSYEVEIWLDRSNWYDKLVKTVRYSYRMHYDNWDTLYCVSAISENRKDEINAGDVAELVHLVCNQLRLKACPLSQLRSDRTYYVTISAEIQALSAERIREIDNWLGGEGSEESAGGMLDFVIGIFGSKGRTAQTKSSAFSPEGLAG
jgi:hypothetical protein